MPNDAVLIALVSETLNSGHLPRRRAAELLFNAARTEHSNHHPGFLRTVVSLANPGLPRDVHAQVEHLIEEFDLDHSSPP